ISYSNCPTATVSTPITVKYVYNNTGDFNLGAKRSQTSLFFNSYGLPTETDEYDYWNGSVYPLIRQTLFTYGSFNGTSCATLGNSIVDKPCQITVKDGNSNTKAQTTYTYDQGTPTTTSGTPQHVSISGSRGNPTTIAQLVAGSTTLSKTFTYFDTG